MPESDLHYSELVEIGRLVQKRRALFGGRDAGPVGSHRQARRRVEKLCLCHGRRPPWNRPEAADQEIAAGKVRGPLHGVPIAVKDLCWTKDAPTAAGMKIYRDNRPSEDATVVIKLKEAGAVILGKLQLTEGAYADHHPKSIRRAIPGSTALVRCVLERLRRRDRGWPLLRHRWGRTPGIDPLSVGRQRRDRLEADLGTRQPLWCVRTGRNARSYRTDGTKRGGLRRNAGRDCRCRPERSNRSS